MGIDLKKYLNAILNFFINEYHYIQVPKFVFIDIFAHIDEFQKKTYSLSVAIERLTFINLIAWKPIVSFSLSNIRW